MPSDRQTWAQAIQRASERLADGAIAESELNAEYLALAVMGIWERSALRSLLDREISVAEGTAFDLLIDRRLAHEPLQYIIGEWFAIISIA